jgi:hypothetical protein
MKLRAEIAAILDKRWWPWKKLSRIAKEISLCNPENPEWMKPKEEPKELPSAPLPPPKATK